MIVCDACRFRLGKHEFLLAQRNPFKRIFGGLIGYSHERYMVCDICYAKLLDFVQNKLTDYDKKFLAASG